jgi:hypothetical protein
MRDCRIVAVGLGGFNTLSAQPPKPTVLRLRDAWIQVASGPLSELGDLFPEQARGRKVL